jgi:hypothetical protein
MYGSVPGRRSSCTTEAKESLSRQQSVTFPLPLTGTDALITRAEFEAMAQPLLLRTVEITGAAILQARLPAGQIAGVFLVGGGSRIPLVATLLHQRQGIAPTALEQPEIVVAEGALAAGQVNGGPVSTPPAHGGAPVSGSPYGAAPVSGPSYGGAAPVSGSPYSGAAPVSGSYGGGSYGGGSYSGGSYSGAAPVSGSAPVSGVPSNRAPSSAPPPNRTPTGATPPNRAPADPPRNPAGPVSPPAGPSLLWPSTAEASNPAEAAPPFTPPPGNRYGTPSTPPPPSPQYLRPEPPPAAADPFQRPAAEHYPPPQDPFTSPPHDPYARPAPEPYRPGAADPFGPPPAAQQSAHLWPSGPPDERGPVRQSSAAAQPPASRPQQNRSLFHVTDLLWPVSGLLWLVLYVSVLDRNYAILFIFTSLTVAVLGYGIDARIGHRLPWWWAKLALPLVLGPVLGFLIGATGLPFAVSILLLLASAAGAWALLRKRP